MAVNPPEPPEIPFKSRIAVEKIVPDKFRPPHEMGWEMIDCPVCGGAKCPHCYETGQIPTGASLRKYKVELQQIITRYKRALADVNSTVALLEDAPPDLLPEALAIMGEDSLAAVMKRADEDRTEWTGMIAKIEEAIVFTDELIVYFRSLIQAVKRQQKPEPPAPAEPEPAQETYVQECEECERLATVFDTDGDGNVSGYCKRHAHARGLLTAPDTGGAPEPTPAPEAPETPPDGPSRSFPMVGGPFNGTRQDIAQGEVAVWLRHKGREYRYDHHGARYVHTGSPDAVRDAR